MLTNNRTFLTSKFNVESDGITEKPSLCYSPIQKPAGEFNQ